MGRVFFYTLYVLPVLQVLLFLECASITFQCARSLCRLIQYVSVEYLLYLSLFRSKWDWSVRFNARFSLFKLNLLSLLRSLLLASSNFFKWHTRTIYGKLLPYSFEWTPSFLFRSNYVSQCVSANFVSNSLFHVELHAINILCFKKLPIKIQLTWFNGRGKRKGNYAQENE